MENYTQTTPLTPKKGRNKSLKIIGIVLLVLLFLGSFIIRPYNRLVSKEEAVDQAWSQVENQYQRRLDLIPNLVNTVKGYASHEKETLEGVIQARANASQIKVDPTNMTDEQLASFNNSQQGLSQALSRLMVVVEKYPELKADENFLQLQAQLEGTENRIAVARKDFNETAQQYNTYRRSFPKNLVAAIFGFKKKPYFEANPEASSAPKVEF